MRNHFINLLRRDLVGPGQGEPVHGSYDEEELSGDLPNLRYAAGILFPQNWRSQKTTSQTATAVDDENYQLESPEDSQLADCYEDGEADVTADSTGDDGANSDENDDPVVTRTRRPPSSIGMSFLCEVPLDGIIVQMTAGFYVKTTRTAEDGKSRDIHRRVPVSFQKCLLASSQLTEATQTLVQNIPVPDGVVGAMELLIQCRNLSSSRYTRRRLMTVSVINRGDRAVDAGCQPAFQCELRVESQHGEGFITPYPEADPDGGDDEEANLRLLYRHFKVYGVGHGCAVNWQLAGERKANKIYTEIMPEHEVKPIVPSVSSGMTLDKQLFADPSRWSVAKSVLEDLCSQYEQWITQQRNAAADLTLPDPQLHAAMKNINGAIRCLKRMREGLSLLDSNTSARFCFHTMNHAMLIQERRYSLPVRKYTVLEGNKLKIDAPKDKDFDLIDSPIGGNRPWYPFQVAFMLTNICCTVNKDHPDREVVDVIWFPTGGGKTEAYLALTAFTIIYRRMTRPAEGGTAVLMRYTLRLLTVQQFARAATLICALEFLRQKNLIPGETPVTAGLWLGNATTPGTRKDARDLLTRLSSGKSATTSFVLQKCPWCGAQIGVVRNGQSIRTPGLEEGGNPKTVIFKCACKECYFHNTPIPVTVIDEDIYQHPSTLVVATVDKLATLPWRPEARSLFGLGAQPCDPPELIIQDELHLISGPLGTMVGLYETAVEALCSHSAKGYSPVKIVASTATISRAAEQCQSLYSRTRDNIAVFPPQCLEAGESFFARVDNSRCGRIYVGIFANGLNSLVTAQIRTFGLLLQGISGVPEALNSYIDPYWTLIAYFSTLRELGYSRTLIDGEVSEYSRVLARRYRWQRRNPADKIVELTSRVTNDEIPRYLEQLSLERTKSEDAVDICLATNMISVGLDVPRLGLMSVVGQPIQTSEYIQATSRVGRNESGPGLIVTIYNTLRARDQSHYERFHSYHASLYRYVEPTSVTPFAPPVRKRALHAVFIILARFWGTYQEAQSPSPKPRAELVARIREVVRRRVERVDFEEAEGVLADFDSLWDDWQDWEPQVYGALTNELRTNNALMVAAAEVAGAGGHTFRSLPTPTSMRTVEPRCAGEIVRSTRRGY